MGTGTFSAKITLKIQCMVMGFKAQWHAPRLNKIWVGLPPRVTGKMLVAQRWIKGRDCYLPYLKLYVSEFQSTYICNHLLLCGPSLKNFKQ